ESPTTVVASGSSLRRLPSAAKSAIHGRLAAPKCFALVAAALSLRFLLGPPTKKAGSLRELGLFSYGGPSKNRTCKKALGKLRYIHLTVGPSLPISEGSGGGQRGSRSVSRSAGRAFFCGAGGSSASVPSYARRLASQQRGSRHARRQP